MSWPNAPPLLRCPSLEADELLSSWLARCAADNVLDSPRAVLKAVYGKSGRALPKGNEFALNLGALCKTLGPWSPCSDPDEWIRRATVYPYFRPFLTSDTDRRAREIMASGSGSGLKTLIGLVANRFGASASPRFCPQCFAEDRFLPGIPILRRTHHLPWVTRCAVHGSRLLDIKASRPGTAIPTWLVRSPDTGPSKTSGESARERVTSADLRDSRQNWFSRMSMALLAAEMPPQDPEARGSAYEAAARRRGHVFRGGRIDFSSLIEDLREHYEDFSFLDCRERLLQPSSNPSAWMRSLITRPGRAAHPICQMLAIGYLFDSLEDFQVAVQEGATRGLPARPTKLIGPVAPKQSQMTRGRHRGLPEQAADAAVLLDASLSCREAARRLAVSINKVASARLGAGLVVKRRPQKINDQVATGLLSQLAVGVALTDIAKSNRVSLSSLYRLLDSYPQVAAERRLAAFDVELRNQRAAWEDAVRRSAGRGSKFARSLAPAAYMWLYRHDPSFVLGRRSGPRRSRTVRSPIVDWDRQDAKLASQLASLARGVAEPVNTRSAPAQTTLESNGGRRRTVSFWIKLLGPCAPHPTRQNRFPKTMSLAHHLAEDEEAFRLRRAREAIADLRRRGLPPEYWRVHRAAGLRQLPMAAFLKALRSESRDPAADRTPFQPLQSDTYASGRLVKPLVQPLCLGR